VFKFGGKNVGGVSMGGENVGGVNMVQWFIGGRQLTV